MFTNPADSVDLPRQEGRVAVFSVEQAGDPSGSISASEDRGGAAMARCHSGLDRRVQSAPGKAWRRRTVVQCEALGLAGASGRMMLE
jgi:hypothetical protein